MLVLFNHELSTNRMSVIWVLEYAFGIYKVKNKSFAIIDSYKTFNMEYNLCLSSWTFMGPGLLLLNK